jgi:hypothetical protein
MDDLTLRMQSKGQITLPLQAISVRQPWAWAIIYAGKDVENRSRDAVANGKREWGFFLVQKGGSVIKLEYTNKDEGDAARIILSKGEHVHKVTSQKPLFAISDALTQAFVTGPRNAPKS